MTAAPDLSHICRDIAWDLAQAKTAVIEGRPVALDGLVGRVADVLASAQALPKREQPALVPELENIHADFEKLETLMRCAIAGTEPR